MSALSWVNGQPAEQVSVDNRGLAYGDGLFETIAIRNQQCQLLELHLSRLFASCKRLVINLDESLLHAELDAFLVAAATTFSKDAILKIMIYRDTSGRGYAADDSVGSIRVLSCTDSPPLDESLFLSGIDLCFCTTPISSNTALAGMKHLSRLENVMARSELNSSPYFEGLMLDDDSNVVEGTMTNLFWIEDGCLLTPLLSKGGVAGVMREWVLSVLAPGLGLAVREIDVDKRRLLKADELFVCNSIHTLLPVRSLASRQWKAWPVTARLIAQSRELLVA